MKTILLLPNKFKKIGWFLLIPATVLGMMITISGFEISWLKIKTFAMFSDEVLGKNQSLKFITTNLTNTVVGMLFIVGAMFVGFSREKKEDEFISSLRLSSLLWAVWVNYILLFAEFLFVYGSPFLTVMIYNMFTVLIIFIVRFNYLLYRNFKTARYEK